MKNRSTILAALALGTVLGAGAASIIPHVSAAPAVTTPDQSVNTRLNALETQVLQLKAEYAELAKRATTTTVYESVPQSAAPSHVPASPPSGYSNIPPYKGILLSTPAH